MWRVKSVQVLSMQQKFLKWDFSGKGIYLRKQKSKTAHLSGKCKVTLVSLAVKKIQEFWSVSLLFIPYCLLLCIYSGDVYINNKVLTRFNSIKINIRFKTSNISIRLWFVLRNYQNNPTAIVTEYLDMGYLQRRKILD